MENAPEGALFCCWAVIPSCFQRWTTRPRQLILLESPHNGHYHRRPDTEDPKTLGRQPLKWLGVVQIGSDGEARYPEPHRLAECQACGELLTPEDITA